MLHITSCEYADQPTYAAATHDPERYVGMPLGTRCLRIVRATRDRWLVWLATTDFKIGTYLVLRDDGMVLRVTARADEGDEVIMVKPAERSK